MAKYRVLQGCHADWSSDGRYANQIYPTGSIVCTSSDLLALNTAGARPKFELIPGTEADVPPKLPADQVFSNQSEYDAWLKANNLTPETATPASVSKSPLASSDTLKSMSVKELKDFAAEQEIPLTGQERTKDDLINTILKATS